MVDVRQEHGLLAGKTVVITRSSSQVKEFAAILEGHGAKVLAFPTIKIVPVASYEQLDRAQGRLDEYDYIIFSSANAVRFFIERWKTQSASLKPPAKTVIAVVGPATAKALEKEGWVVGLVPEEHRAEALVEMLKKTGMAGKKVLIPRAQVAREVLPEELLAAGAEVQVIPVYQTVPETGSAAEVTGLLSSGKIDVITFTSASTVKNFYQRLSTQIDLPKVLLKVKIACIGPVTADAAKELGLTVDVIADDYTIDGLIGAIVKLFD